MLIIKCNHDDSDYDDVILLSHIMILIYLVSIQGNNTGYFCLFKATTLGTLVYLRQQHWVLLSI